VSEASSTPLVSVVIPTCNRPAQLARCLASIETVRRPGPIEVVVVDDGGSVPLDRIVEPFRETIGAVLIRKPHGGPGAARNLGVVRARGRYIVFTDDDCAFDEGAIVAFVDGLAAAPGAMVGGRTINALPGNPFAAASQAIVDAVYAYNNPDPADARFFASNNMAAERSAILACGGFDERFTGAAEDRELCDRWRHRGDRLVYRPEAVIYHAHDLRLGSFVRQHRAYGRGAYTYHRVRASRGSGRMRDDLRFHAELPARLLASARRVPAGTAARGAALAVVWQAVNAAGWAEAAATDATQRVSQRLPRRGTDNSALGPPPA
jgi:GT2 family glycosyltransferase